MPIYSPYRLRKMREEQAKAFEIYKTGLSMKEVSRVVGRSLNWTLRAIKETRQAEKDTIQAEK